MLKLKIHIFILYFIIITAFAYIGAQWLPESKAKNKNLPFLFVLSPDPLRVDKIFIPFKEYPNQTDAYLKNVKSILND